DPKNDVWPFDPPWQVTRSSASSSGCQSGGQDIGVAVRLTAAATADGDHPGCSCFTSAATPVACGAAIDVPWIHAYDAGPAAVVMPGNTGFSGSRSWKIDELAGMAARIASCTVSLAER